MVKLPACRVAFLALLLALAGCGPRADERAAAQAVYDQALRHQQLALACLAAQDWPGAAAAAIDLQALLQRPDRRLVEVRLRDRSVVAHLEQMRDELRAAAHAGLPGLRERYLDSRVSLAHVDEWLPVFAVDDWPARRTAWLAEAARRAAGEWRLALPGDALPGAARDALLRALHARLAPASFNLGYDLAERPAGSGTITLTVSLTGDVVRDTAGNTLGILPREVTLTCAASTAAGETAPLPLPASIAVELPEMPASQPFAVRSRQAAQLLAERLAAALSPPPP